MSSVCVFYCVFGTIFYRCFLPWLLGSSLCWGLRFLVLPSPPCLFLSCPVLGADPDLVSAFFAPVLPSRSPGCRQPPIGPLACTLHLLLSSQPLSASAPSPVIFLHFFTFFLLSCFFCNFPSFFLFFFCFLSVFSCHSVFYTFLSLSLSLTLSLSLSLVSLYLSLSLSHSFFCLSPFSFVFLFSLSLLLSPSMSDLCQNQTG